MGLYGIILIMGMNYWTCPKYGKNIVEIEVLTSPNLILELLLSTCFFIWRFPKSDTPKWLVYFMENPLYKWDEN